MRPPFPFAAIVGQEDLKLGLILTIINPQLSGILIRGEKGTAKSTAVRALAQILPAQEVIAGCPFRLSPTEHGELCQQLGLACAQESKTITQALPVVELPVGATEDRVAGTLDLERALSHGQRHFEAGLLAAAHRGILYVDEVNLLEDHIVDLLLDSAAMGVNTVEREGISISHPARFSLVGTMNPEEGELRPQLLDRFGMCITIAGSQDRAERVAIMQRRSAYEADPVGFCDSWQAESQALADQIMAAIKRLDQVKIADELLFTIAEKCLAAGVDGHRADIMMLRAAKTIAAWRNRIEVTSEDIAAAASFVLPHRMRRLPLQTIEEVAK